MVATDFARIAGLRKVFDATSRPTFTRWVEAAMAVVPAIPSNMTESSGPLGVRWSGMNT